MILARKFISLPSVAFVIKQFSMEWYLGLFILFYCERPKQKAFTKVFCFMKPFNIKIQVAEEEVTLTILPYDQDCYRVIYFGGILGALKRHKSSSKWELLPFEEAIGDDLPPYTPNDDEDRIEIALNTDIVEEITREIVKHVSF